MKKTIALIIVVLSFVLTSLFFVQETFSFEPPPPATPEACQSGIRPEDKSTRVGAWCPDITGTELEIPPPYRCADGYDTGTSPWINNRHQNLWVNDHEVTSLGKGGERSRQFLWWAVTKQTYEAQHPAVRELWGFVRNIVYLFLLGVAIVMGLGLILAQRGYGIGLIGERGNLNIEISSLIIKLVVLILYATFSFAIVQGLVELTDILMEFFIKTLGVRDLFNIFFVEFTPGRTIVASSEEAYYTFQGCSNLNVDNIEMVRTSKFLVNFTNMTYYLLGIMMILRKVILWFLLIVSPFLAILMPFIFIRNIGWIWIGVFFQWAFYGPLFALFLGGLAKIWSSAQHIPYLFDFSRRNRASGWIYPTSINILYGGPAQKLELMNTSNYIDTFAEYIISLIMLWTVVFLPWWLLRIFRDYCCEGIYAAKNILAAMYDQLTAPVPPPPPPVAPVPVPTTTTGLAREVPRAEEVVARIKLETTQEIKQAKTEEIARHLEVKVTKLTDIARFETTKETKETVNRNITKLQNPMRAETPTERQRFMTMRTELYERAAKGDVEARQMLSSISTSKVEQVRQKEQILETIPQLIPVVKTTSIKVGLPQKKTASVIRSIFTTISTNDEVVRNIATASNVTSQETQTILRTMVRQENLDLPITALAEKVSEQTGIEKEKVKQVISTTAQVFREQETVDQIAAREQIEREKIETIIREVSSTVEEKEVESLVKVVATKADLPVIKTTSVVKSAFITLSQNENIVQTIASQSHVTTEQAETILQAMTKEENLTAPTTRVIENISRSAGIEKEKVREVIDNSSTVFKQQDLASQLVEKEQIEKERIEKIIEQIAPAVKEKEVETIVKVVSVKVGVPVERATTVVKAVFESISKSENIVQTIASQSNVSQSQAQTILNQLTREENLNQPSQNLVQNIAEKTGVEQQKVRQVIGQTITVFQRRRELLEQIAREENIKREVVQKVLTTHLPAAAEPEKHIEDTISIPPTVSIEDYEEVKNMWVDHYEKGEVPVSAKIKDRDDWVASDIVVITNILNKILSTDAKIKSQGLEELAYILPVFMINNLKGTELAVYLKAKLEAAKQVMKQLELEEEAREKAKEEEKEEEVLVEAPRVAEKEKEKEMEMKMEMEVEGEKKEEKQGRLEKPETETETEAGAEVEESEIE